MLGFLDVIEVQLQGSTVSAYNFGPNIIGLPGTPVMLTIVNKGPFALSLGGQKAIDITGTNASDFALTAAPADTLPSGQSTTFALGFTALGAGTRTATVKVAPTGGGSGASFTLTGTGSGSGSAAVGVSYVDSSGIPHMNDAVSNGGTIDFGSIKGSQFPGIIVTNQQPSNPLYLVGSPYIQMSGGGAGFYDLAQPGGSNPISTVPNGSSYFVIGD